MVINCKGRILDLSDPIIMGILNVTPDSFYDGGRSFKMEDAMNRAGDMIAEGATIIDVGGMSTRPGAKIIDEEEELNRIIPIISGLNRKYPSQLISVDTVRSRVAEKAIQSGASLVNDVSAGNIDPEIIDVVVDHGVPYILMHMKGKPEDMQTNPKYENVVKDVLNFLAIKSRELRRKNVKDIIVDPGFGFGKSLEHNYKLLQKLSVFRILEMPILVGVSRKSMIYKLLKISPEEALNGTTACNTVALSNGAKILRVHDVKEAVETVRIFNQICRKSSTD